MARRLAIAGTLASFALAAEPALADGVAIEKRISTEVAGYTDTVGVSVFTPSIGAVVEAPTEGWSVNGRYLLDVVSAASPDIVATASPRWSEVRNAGNLGVRYKPGWFGVAGGGAVSYTNDYLSLSGNGQLIQDLDDKNLTLTEGYSYGHDVSGRTDTPFKTFSYDLATHAGSLGLSRVVNPSLVVGATLDGIFELGNQSKPYRYIAMFSPEEAALIPRGTTAYSVADARVSEKPLENLPRSRQRFAIAGRVAYRGDRSTIKIDERLYRDSWELMASTTDFRWYIDLADRVTFWPHLRFHIQNGVNFWERAYVADSIHDIPVYRTGDREMSPLKNFGTGGGVRFALGHKGALQDLVLQVTADGTWTAFDDALYVKNRFSILGATSVEYSF